MSIGINELRISLVWKKSFAKDTYLPYLADRDRFLQEFISAKQNQGSWLIPWVEGERQHFWQYYLWTREIGDLEKVDENRAWDYLIPLRLPNTLKIKTDEGLRISLEGYCFPHSVGVIATLFMNWKTPIPIKDAIDQAIICRHAQYTALWHNRPNTHGSLQSLASELVDTIHKKVLETSSLGEPLNDPISIATVVDAEGVFASSGQENISPQSALFGLCKLEKGWRSSSLIGLVGMEGTTTPDLKPVTPSKEPVDIAEYQIPRFYAFDRSRAIWDPQKFSGGQVTAATPGAHPRQRKLGCYHRNLTLATLQVNGLTQLVNRAYEFLPLEKIPTRLVNPVKQAIKLLRSSYKKDDKSYNTWSVLHQITCNKPALERYKTVAKAVGESWE